MLRAAAEKEAWQIAVKQLNAYGWMNMEGKECNADSDIVKEIMYIAEIHGLTNRERCIKIADLLNEHFSK